MKHDADYNAASFYSLDHLEQVIGLVTGLLRQTYIENWIDRAEICANSPRLDAADWQERLERNRKLWLWCEHLV